MGRFIDLIDRILHNDFYQAKKRGELPKHDPDLEIHSSETGVTVSLSDEGLRKRISKMKPEELERAIKKSQAQREYLDSLKRRR